MFKDEYNKQFEDIAPSPALNEETLALMQEAQAHATPKNARPQKLRWVLPVCVSGAAAMLALTVGLAFWFSRPEEFNDIMGNPYNELFLQAGDSAISDESGADNPASNDSSADDKATNDADSSAPADPQQDNTSSDAGTAENDDASNTAQPDENKGAAADPEKAPEQDEEVEDPAPEQPESDASQSTPPAEAVDPKAPVEITDKKTETYLSLRAFLDAVSAKKTIGYKTNYLMEESLAIVPTWLPTTARFRQVYAYSNGGYTYSYLLAGESESYFLNVAVSATQPKTQRDLQLRVKGIGEEEKLLKKTQNQWIYYFGNYDKAIVTVTTIDGKAVSMEQAAPLLTTLKFGRYTVQNGLVELTYN